LRQVSALLTLVGWPATAGVAILDAESRRSVSSAPITPP
jgi:hypothetical protein